MRNSLLLFLAITGLPLCAQFDLVFDQSPPVARDGAPLEMPWAGGINFSQWNNIDLDGDGDLDLFAFDRSGDEVITLLNDGPPGTVNYHYTKEFDDVYPFNELHDWALLRDYNCDGKPDIWSYSLGGARVFKNTSSGGGLSFQLVDTLVRSNYQGTDANLYIIQTDIAGIEDIDNDGDLDVISFSIFGSYLDYHKNLSMELYGTCDSLEFDLRNRCWGYFSEDVNTNTVNLDDSCMFNVPNPEMPIAIHERTAELIRNFHRPLPEAEERSSAHVGSTILPIDLDDDDVKDLLLGDVLYTNVVPLFNDGTVDANHMADQDTLFPSYDEPANVELFPGCYYVDVDGDDVRDLIVAVNSTSLGHNYESVWYYRNIGTDGGPLFDFQSIDLFQGEMIEVGEGAYPVLFDYNSDGLMDVIVANYGYFQSGGNYPSKMALLANSGTANAPAFTQITDDWEDLSLSGIGQAMYPAFGDIDNDGDKDMYVGDLQGRMHFFTNTPSGGIADFTLTTPNITDLGGTMIDVGQFAKPQFFDVDGDGKLDLLVGERNGNINYYRNNGTLGSPGWQLINDSLGGVVVKEYWNVTGYSVPLMFINDAGQRELLVGSESGWIWDFGDIDGNLTGTFTLLDSTWQGIKDGSHSSIVLHDFTGDSWKDALTGNYRGGIGFWRNDFGVGVHESGTEGGSTPFTLFPNPVSGNTQIDLNVPLVPNMVVILVNDLGQEVLRTPVKSDRVVLRTEALDNGVYVARLEGDGRIWTARLVVLR